MPIRAALIAALAAFVFNPDSMSPIHADGGTCDTLLVGVTGSVGVLEMPHVVKLFRQTLARDVYVMMSRAAQKFVTPYSFQLFSDHEVHCDAFAPGGEFTVPHIELVQRADLFVIAPATANVLGKCAHGLCDDLITTSVVAHARPVVFVPCMNDVMWLSKVVQRNVAILRELGHHVIEPATGFEIVNLEVSRGAMPNRAQLLAALSAFLKQQGAAAGGAGGGAAG